MRYKTLTIAVALASALHSPARAAPLGQLDPKFSADGIASTAFDIGGDLNDDVLAQVVGQGGATFLIGRASVDAAPLKGAVAIAKFQHDGKLDATFGDGGRALLSLPANGLLPGSMDGAVSVDGGLVVVANIPETGDRHFAMVCRLGKTGKPDAAFGELATPGCIRIRSPGLPENDSTEVLSIALRQDGTILLGGEFIGGFGAPVSGFAALTPNGKKVDESFGESGFTTFSGSLLDHVLHIELTPDGGVLGLSELRNDPLPERIAMIKANAMTGQPFEGFGDGGYLALELPFAQAHQRGYAFDVTKDGAIFLLGQRVGPQLGKSSNFVAEIDSSGKLIGTFGAGGIVEFEASSLQHRDMTDIKSVDDGVIAVGGWDIRPGVGLWGAVKLDTHGKMDLAFGNAGSVFVPLLGKAHHVELQGRRIVLSAGAASQALDANVDFHISRLDHGLNQNLSVTPSAGANGSISPSVTLKVLHSDVAEFKVLPKLGYRIAKVSGCGAGELIGARYRTGPVVGACQVKATFEKIPFSP